MSNRSKIFLGVRKGNGQIGYFSESLSLPEFFELIRPTEDHGSALVDFSPVIESLHSIHDKQTDQSILEKYNSVFNYWQESKSYENLQIKLPKFEHLSQSSNELINRIQFRMNEYKANFVHRKSCRSDENYKLACKLESDANVYIDVLLCFIHAKASIEIKSFKKDVVLGRYCSFLNDLVIELYCNTVEYSTYREDYNLSNSSLLYSIAFNSNDASTYTKLLPSFNNQIDLQKDLINKGKKYDGYNEQNEASKKIEIEYRIPSHYELKTAEILRNIIYKSSSVSRLVERLREGEVEWDPSDDPIEELKLLIKG